MSEQRAKARLAVDIGGTFTDLVLERADGRRLTTKLLTTYDHPGRAVLEGIQRILQMAGVKASEVGLIIHGTTLATNALIERRGARTALLTTAGHRDALELAHEDRFEQYDIMIDRPAPLVPRYLRLPVRERLGPNGEVLLPLDQESLEEALPVLDEHQVESVAIGYLHAFVNPEHEQRSAEWLQRQRPELSITLASEVCPEIREFERLSTACANAYVQPLMKRYLLRLSEELGQHGLDCPFLLMTSGGGLTTLETAARFPIRLVESGPAGGAVLAAHMARQARFDRVLSFDMGGTTAKLCLIDDSQPLQSRSFEVDRVYRFKKGSGLPVRVPVIEMVEIGAGGGSIAQLDTLQRIQVGPASAGSEPGPAAYGRGGELPTVTDADVLLGRVHAASFAGGAFSLDTAAAEQAVKRGLASRDEHNAVPADVDELAVAIAEIVEENMAAAARAHAAEFGLDVAARDMVAFGGAAPLHAARLGEKLGVQRIIVPSGAGVGSAVGFLLAPVSYEVVRSRRQRLDQLDAALVKRLFDEMRDEAEAVVQQATPRSKLLESKVAYMRYVGQGHEIAVCLPDLEDELGSEAAGRAYQQAFEQKYRQLYGRCMDGVAVEVLSWTLTLAAEETAIGLPETKVDAANQASNPDAPGPTAGSVDPPVAMTRQRFYDPARGRWVQAPVYRRDSMPAGSSVSGPALITEDQTTTVLSSAWQAQVDPAGHLLLTRQQVDDSAAETSSRAALIRGGSPPGLNLQLGWDRLLAIVEEQAQTLIRTAFSTTVREAGDLSAGVFDTHGRMLAQAVTGTPGHVNAMAASVDFFLQKYPLERLQPGDVLLTNDPWHGTGHLNDFTVVTPVFLGQRPVALFASTSHIADVGGLGFGPDGRQVFEEGLNIPIGYLFRAGEPNRTLLEIIRANVRDPLAAEGDLYSLATCNAAGASRLLESLNEFGLDSLDTLAEHIIEHSRQAMLAEIARLPQGEWRYAMRVDGYDQPVDLECCLRIGANGITLDFDGSSTVSGYGINVPLTYTQAYASFGVRCVVGNHIPNNAGSLDTVEVTAPAGTILNAPRPAAVSARHAIGQMLPDVVLGCLQQPLQGMVPAEGASCLFGPVFMGGKGVIAGSGSPPFVINAFYTGGTGGRPGKDGLNATAFPSGVRSTPVEITENAAPLLLWRKELRPGSGGAGACRGGLGQVLEFAHAQGEAFAVSRMFDRLQHPPRGRDGGGSGAPTRVYLKRPDGSEQELRGMGRQQVPAGTRFVIETAGGGGLGAPGLRDTAEIARDRLNGLVLESID